MLTEVKVPGFPESVTDGTIVSWHKKPGDTVKRDENLVDIETDKVMFEVPAPADGTLQEICQQEGAVVTAGQLLARIDERAAPGAQAAPPAAARAPAAPPAPAAGEADKVITPSARRLMAEHGLRPEAVAGSGRNGRVLKEDVLSVLEGAQPAVAAAPVAAEPLPQPLREPAPELARPALREVPRPVELPAERRPEKRVPMTRLRARIAERLVEAQHTAAILSTFNEVNMAPVMELRRRYRERFEKEFGVKLGLMSFFIKAAVGALKKFPVVNASLDGTDIVYHGFFDIGVAVASPRGLVVPIVRDADELGMADIERQIAEYADKAQRGALAMEEITGGTFTITNGGVFGSLLSTPILNPPQSGILGMHKIQDRPMVENGEIVIRPMMYLALSYDHRIIDGREAVQFLVSLKEALEDPARMLLEI